MNRTPPLLLAFHWLFAIFMLAPLAMVALVSFTDKGYISMPFDGASWRWYAAILKNGETILDRTGARKETIKLPNERIGLLMVFRTFEKVSYALVLEINDTPRAGDFLVNP